MTHKRWNLAHATRGARNETGDSPFEAVYLHYVEQCQAIAAEPLPRDELRALLAEAHAQRARTPQG